MAPPARVLVVAGPTAVGKSSAALRLCEARDGELVSADSVQLYRGLDVGSNKPSPAELKRVRHHLVDVADAVALPDEERGDTADLISGALGLERPWLLDTERLLETRWSEEPRRW